MKVLTCTGTKVFMVVENISDIAEIGSGDHIIIIAGIGLDLEADRSLKILYLCIVHIYVHISDQSSNII